MSWTTIAASQFTATFGASCPSVCPAWFLEVGPLVLDDLDMASDLLDMPDGSTRSFPQRPQSTKVTLAGQVFSDATSAGVATSPPRHLALVANINDLRAQMAAARAVRSDGLTAIAVKLNGTAYLDLTAVVGAVKVTVDNATFAEVRVDVEIPPDGVSAP